MSKPANARRNERSRLYVAQKGRCCYCDKVMDIAPANRFSDAAPTVEHLQRREDGGTDRIGNLALACTRCNWTRGKMNWLEFCTLKRDGTGR